MLILALRVDRIRTTRDVSTSFQANIWEFLYMSFLGYYFDYIWSPWTELSQWKYGPIICRGQGRCETGLLGSRRGYMLAQSELGKEKNALSYFLFLHTHTHTHTRARARTALEPWNLHRTANVESNALSISLHQCTLGYIFSCTALFFECLL